MPNPLPYPRGAVAPRVDLRQWQDVTLFSFASTQIDAPADWGPYADDVLALLTGRGTIEAANRCSMAAGASAALTAASSVTISITSEDKIGILAAGLADHFTLGASADNAVLGFDPAGQTSVTVAGGEYIEAPNTWQRGNVANVGLAPKLTSSVADGATTGNLVTPQEYRAHSVLDLVRSIGSADVDDSFGAQSLASLSPTVRWGIDDDGYVWMARNTTVQANALTWGSTSFRDMLGFTGAEVETTPAGATNLRILTATHPCRLLLTPWLPFEKLLDEAESVGNALLLTSGRSIWTETQWLRRYVVDLWVDGYMSRIDRARHFLDHLARLLAPGSWVNVYQDWGEGRRARRTWEVVPGNANSPAYSKTHTSQRDGDYGRLRCYVDRGASKVFSLEYEGQVRQRARVTLPLIQRPDTDA